jgi:ketosteroid isomerase-like protein
MSDIDKPIARVMDAYAQAVFDKDVDGLMRLYEPGVRVFDTWGVWSYEGAEAWQVAVEGWFSSLAAGRCRVRFEDVQAASHSGQLASLSAVVSYAALSSTGETERSMHNRISWLLRTSGHALRIFHEHTSAPIGFEDEKAMLRR